MFSSKQTAWKHCWNRYLSPIIWRFVFSFAWPVDYLEEYEIFCNIKCWYAIFRYRMFEYYKITEYQYLHKIYFSVDNYLPKHLLSSHSLEPILLIFSFYWISRETRLKLKEGIFKCWCPVLGNNIKNKGIRDITVSKVKSHPRYTRQWEEKWLTNICAWWCLPFPPPAEAWDSCLSSNARVQGRKKGHRKTSPVQTTNRTVLFQLKNVYVNVSLMKETELTEVETRVFSSGTD